MAHNSSTRIKAAKCVTSDSIERRLQYAPAARRGHVSQAAVAAAAAAAAPRIQLRVPSRPGVRENAEGCVEHWQASLAGTSQAAELLRHKCCQELQQQRADGVAAGDTVALRRAANASLSTQMAHFNGCLQAWAGPAPRLQ